MMAKKGGMPKPDFRPRNFAWVMRREIGLFLFSCAMGFFFIPWWWNGMLRTSRNSQQQTLVPNGQVPIHG